MAARRSSRPSTGTRSRRPSARTAQANTTTPIIIGAGVLVVVVAIAVMTMTGDNKSGDGGNKAPSPTVKPVAPEAKPKKAAALPAARPGKDPTTPAPDLTNDFLTKADAYYLKAKKIHDDGRRAQAAGNNKEFNKLMNDSWDTLENLDSFIETYTDWLEEADMEEWRVPAIYVKLQKRLSIYDKLRGGLRRVKGNRQK